VIEQYVRSIDCDRAAVRIQAANEVPGELKRIKKAKAAKISEEGRIRTMYDKLVGDI
jgi:hypothetical protein